MKRNLLFGVDNTMKRDILNPKEVNKMLATRTEKKSVRKVGGGQDIGKIKQTVNVLIEEFKKNNPGVHQKWPDNYILVDTEEKLDDLLVSIKFCRRFAYDTETMGLEIWHGDHIVGMSFYTPNNKKCWYVPLRHISCVDSVDGKQLPIELVKEKMAPVMEEKRQQSLQYSMKEVNSLNDVDLNEERIGVVTFNGKFDSHVIRINLGIEMPDIAFEGYLAAKVLNENEKNPRLKPLCNQWLKPYKSNPLDAFDEIFEKTPCAYFPIWMVGYYACKDAQLHWEWMEFAEAQINKRPGLAESFYVIQLPVLPAIIASEKEGIKVNEQKIAANRVEFEGYQTKIEKAVKAQLQIILDAFLEENTHIKVVTIPSTTQKKQDKVYSRAYLHNELIKDLNINSTTQLGELFYDIFGWSYSNKEGKSTNEKVMKRLAKTYPVCKSILDYRTVKKMIGTYCDGLTKQISPVDGRVHTSFNPFGAVTNRFSSSGPNLQNIPSKSKKLTLVDEDTGEIKEVKIDFGKKIRQVFVGDSDEYVLCSTDYSQIEPRILAVLSGEETMLDAYRNNKDVYVSQAMLFFPGHPDAEYYDDDDAGFKSPWRSKVKSIVLGLNYGMTEVGLAEGLDCTEAEAKREMERYFDTFPKIKDFTESSQKFAKKNGYIEMLYHTKRRLPDLLDSRFWVRQEAERQIVNSKIQGSSAEITKRAITFIYRNDLLRKLGVKLLLNVHDEVITMIPKVNLDRAVPLIKQCMIQACDRIVEMGGITIKVDAEVSESWYGPAYHWEGHEELDEDNEKLIIDDDEEIGSSGASDYEESVFA